MKQKVAKSLNDKPYLLVLICILFAASICGGCNGKDTQKESLNEGLKLYEDGQYDAARVIFENLAKEDYAPAFTNIGMMHANGNGYDKNHEEAAIWYKLGVIGGDPVAASNLGFLYIRGLGVEQDCPLGLKLLNEAAAVNEPFALSRLGRTYSKGLCGEIDADQAVEYYKQSIQLGNEREAGFDLALLYYKGEIVPNDCKESLKLLSTETFKNNGQALRLIGRIYDTGCAGQRDMEKAFEWYYKAALAGDKLSLQIIESLTQ